jgi:uncharacterized pyridoxal phosphate-containing UPF0001 family protein
MIKGQLQSNKIKQLVQIDNLYAIESVGNRNVTHSKDSLKKAKMINEAWSFARPLKIFLQVNTSGEASKAGILPSEAVHMSKEIVHSCPKLDYVGLMTIGAAEHDTQGPNPDFLVMVAL